MDEENKNMNFKINPKRLRYILDLYKISDEEFISILNKDRKRNLLNHDDLKQILNQKREVDAPLLKRIDNIFERGLTWYISKRDLPEKKSSSIFFRKESFNSELNFESKKIINNFEELKFEIQTLCRYIDFKSKKRIKTYQISDDAENVAKEIKEKFTEFEKSLSESNVIQKPRSDRDYLKNLMRIIEEFNVFVFEFIDRKRLEEKKVSFNGLFINPNIIVIKRQGYLRREIFTLMHEFAHCLLNEEEVDKKVGEEYIVNSNDIEKWCNRFTYHFLIGNYNSEIKKLTIASKENSFHRKTIENLYEKTYLSRSALYTQLRINNKISSNDYNKIINEIKISVNEKRLREKEKLKLERERLEEIGEKPFIPSPKPIDSNLFNEILKINYFQGNINENILRDYFKKIGKSIKNIYEVTY
jgi:Zn-dependent peptidase ImmA (M78 family)